MSNYKIQNSLWNQQILQKNIWSSNIYDGINPPYPETLNAPILLFSRKSESIPNVIPDINNKYINNENTIYMISSPRYPYGMDFLNNGYGSLGMKLGTELGRN